MCRRCEELEARVAWLEDQLGVSRDLTRQRKLRDAMEQTAPSQRTQAAQFALALYDVRGRVMSREHALHSVPSKSPRDDDDRYPKIVDVWACQARKSLGKPAIATITGLGYQTTATGLQTVSRILGEVR